MQTLTREFTSDAVNELKLDPTQGRAQVEFKNGNKYEYTNVSKDAINSLISTAGDESALLPSIGRWVNQFLVGAEAPYTQLA